MVSEDISLSVDDIDIEGRLYLPGRGGRFPYPAVCICHGIPSGRPPGPGDVGYPSLAERICKEGFAVFIFNFRGTGASGGNLDMAGWAADLKAVLDYLFSLPVIDGSRFLLFGSSAGAAVSVYTAAGDSRVSGVIACACPAEFDFTDSLPVIERFRSIGAIRDADFPRSAEEWLEGFRTVNPLMAVARIAPRPLLMVHGNRDEVVDVGNAYRLYAGAGEPKQLIIVDGANHGLRHNDRAMAIVIDWLKTWLRS